MRDRLGTTTGNAARVTFISLFLTSADVQTAREQGVTESAALFEQFIFGDDSLSSQMGNGLENSQPGSTSGDNSSSLQ